MLSADELEQLSRFEAGELEPEEAALVAARLTADPVARQALAVMRELSAASTELPLTLDEASAGRLVERALSPAAPDGRTLDGGRPTDRLASAGDRPHRAAGQRRREWRRPLTTFVAGAAAAAAVALVVLPPATALQVTALRGEVRLQSRQLVEGTSLRLRGGDRVANGEAGAAVVSSPGGALFVPAYSTVAAERDGHPRLVTGAALALGGPAARLTVRAGADEVTLAGRALLLMEPADQVARVTQALDPLNLEAAMNRWMTLGPTAAAGALAGSALTLLVLHGSATVSSAGAAPLTVAAGQRWAHGDTAPTPIGAPATAKPTAARDTSALQADPADEPLELKPLTRAQLVARIEALRDEKETLLREQAALRRREAPGDDRRSRNNYRFTPDELAADAAKGQLQVRLPYVGGDAVRPIKPQAAKAVDLRPEEEAAIKAIYSRSAERVHAGLTALYREIGGHGDVAAGFTTMTLLQELRDKALEGEFVEAIRQLADERAGLRPAADPAAGPAVLRAYRLLMIEDDRVISELEALLGPARAEQLLNHENANRSNHSWGVGPAEKR